MPGASLMDTMPRGRNLPVVRSLGLTATSFPQPRRGLGPLCGFSMLKAAPPFPVQSSVNTALPPPSEPVSLTAVERRPAVGSQREDASPASRAASPMLEDVEIALETEDALPEEEPELPLDVDAEIAA